jgi:16S rRNA processing protein RimM
VVRPHGFDGTLLIELYGDDPANLLAVEVVTLSGEPGTIPFRVRGASEAGLSQGHARVRMTLHGLDSRERAELWSGARLSIPERALRPLPEGEFYWRELLGLRCRLPDGRDLGVIQEIWPGAQNDVLVVRAGSRTRLVPALRQLLVRLDRAAGELWIDPPAGLLEEE